MAGKPLNPLGVQGRAKRARSAAVSASNGAVLAWHKEETAKLEALHLEPAEAAAATRALLKEFAQRQRRGQKNASARNSTRKVLTREVNAEAERGRDTETGQA